MKCGNYILLFFFLITGVSLYPQENPFRQLTVEDGLANSVVYRIYQDEKGYLWFSTDYGLSKYDGYGFSNFYKSGGLSSNYIMSVTEDSLETKWVSCYTGGISALNPDGSIGNPLLSPPREPIDIEYVSGRIWILDSESAIRYFSISDNKLHELSLSQDEKEYVLSFTASGDALYVSTNRKIYKVSGTTADLVSDQTGASFLDVDDYGNVFGVSGT